MTPHLNRLIDRERRLQTGAFAAAAACAAIASMSAVFLLGLSGWFITASAVAGLAGPAAALAFNYVLPSAGIRLLAITRTVGRYGERIKGHEGALRVLARIRPAFFASLAAAPPQIGLGLSGGEASARLIQDIGAIETRLVCLSGYWAAAAAAVAGVALTWLAGWPAAIVLSSALLVSVLSQRWLARCLTVGPAGDFQRASGELKDVFATLAQSAAELRCYGLEDWATEAIDGKGRLVDRAQQESAAALGWMAVLRALLSGLAVVAVLAGSTGAPAPLAALAALATLIALEGMDGLARTFEQHAAAKAAGLRLEPILKYTPSAPGRDPLANFTLNIGRHTLLPGRSLGVVGPSGSGKTSLFQGLVGLRAPAACTIFIGGTDLAVLAPEDARPLFSYAPQDVCLLAGTVRENLAVADPEASDAEMWNALHDAGLDLRIRDEADGLDLWIGENGARLSGGERRRLSLARALLRSAPWLILDEPTEGLDAWTEALIVNRLRERLKHTGQGLLLATHRRAPLKLVSQVVELGVLAPMTQAAHGRAETISPRNPTHAP